MLCAKPASAESFVEDGKKVGLVRVDAILAVYGNDSHSSTRIAIHLVVPSMPASLLHTDNALERHFITFMVSIAGRRRRVTKIFPRRFLLQLPDKRRQQTALFEK